MKWWIAIFVAVLASAVPALSQSGEQVTEYATGTLDYENVGEHDCKPGIEVPVRFIAENVELKNNSWNHLRSLKTVTIRRGSDVAVYEVDHDKLEKLPDNSFFLDVDVTLCITAFRTIVSSGDWKVRHENGEDDLVVSGVFSKSLTWGGKCTFDGGLVVLGAGLWNNLGDLIIRISLCRLDIPRLNKADESLPSFLDAKVLIKVEPANTSEEVSND